MQSESFSTSPENQTIKHAREITQFAYRRAYESRDMVGSRLDVTMSVPIEFAWSHAQKKVGEYFAVLDASKRAAEWFNEGMLNADLRKTVNKLLKEVLVRGYALGYGAKPDRFVGSWVERISCFNDLINYRANNN